MKTIYFFLPLLLILFVACEKEDDNDISQPDISNISFQSSSVAGEAQHVEVTIIKPTPCHEISEVAKEVDGLAFNYNFIIPELEENTACIQVIKEEKRNVSFDPSIPGEYTLNFYINGLLYETRVITVN